MNEKDFEKTMDIITSAISDAGYDVREQLTGFLLTGDPTYITRRNDARTLMQSRLIGKSQDDILVGL